MATGKAKGVKKAVNVAKKTAVKTAKTAAANPQVTLYVLGGIAVLTGIWYLSKGLKKTAKVLSGEGIQANIDIGIIYRLTLLKPLLQPTRPGYMLHNY